MITVPTWIILGFPLPVALAASQLNGALWTPIASFNYLKNSSIDWSLISGLAAFGLLGAYCGTQVVLQADQQQLQRIFGFIILSLVVLTGFNRKFGVTAHEPRVSKVISSALALPLGFYETLFGSGNGMFSSAMLVKTRGFILTTALGYYYLISFTWCCLGSFMYIKGGFGDSTLMLPSSLGGISGAYLGSLIGRKRGPKFVKAIFLGIGTLLGFKLALGW